jgi:hypothetical protein
MRREMSRPLIGEIHELLKARGPLTAREVAGAMREVSEHQGEQSVLLLMRLDPLLEPATGGRWAIRNAPATDEERIVEAAQAHFNATGKRGFPTPRLVAQIVASTGFGEPQVKKVLFARFKNNRLNIYCELLS